MSRKNLLLKLAAAAVCLCAAVVIGLCATHNIGITEGKLEQDIRKNSHIADTWQITGEASDTVAAYISYAEDLSAFTYSIYVNRPGPSFGYFFRAGGTASEMDRGIVKVTAEDYTACAYLSMNRPGAAALEIDDGNRPRRIELDPEKPFAVVLPVNAGTVTFLREDGSGIEYSEKQI